MIVDLRSDTVTRPTPAMRRAMAEAEVGDDVYREDPTVRRLEEEAAERLGFEAALYVPTGTMGNQIAVNLHAPQGTSAIVEADSHVYHYELGAMAAWSGVMPRLMRGRDGTPEPDAVRREAQATPYYHSPVTLLMLENTHNHAGGLVVPLERQRELLAVARDTGLRTHLDGARIFNAAAALGVGVRDVARGFDSVMFCLSKGLGAPVGSLFCSSEANVERARVVRKRLGGGMRQSGVLAAAGLVALREHVDRIVEDHHRARILAETLDDTPGFGIDPERVQTNIVIAEVDPPDRVNDLLAHLRGAGVLAGGMGHGRVRFVTHLDVDDAGIEHARRALREFGRL